MNLIWISCFMQWINIFSGWSMNSGFIRSIQVFCLWLNWSIVSYVSLWNLQWSVILLTLDCVLSHWFYLSAACGNGRMHNYKFNKGRNEIPVVTSVHYTCRCYSMNICTSSDICSLYAACIFAWYHIFWLSMDESQFSDDKS